MTWDPAKEYVRSKLIDLRYDEKKQIETFVQAFVAELKLARNSIQVMTKHRDEDQEILRWYNKAQESGINFTLDETEKMFGDKFYIDENGYSVVKAAEELHDDFKKLRETLVDYAATCNAKAERIRKIDEFIGWDHEDIIALLSTPGFSAAVTTETPADEIMTLIENAPADEA